MGSEYRIEKSEREDNKMDNRYEVDGFLFEIPTEYEKAKKEYEAIRYIKTKTDLDNTANVAKLYNKLLEKQNFITPVGLSFLMHPPYYRRNSPKKAASLYHLMHIHPPLPM